MRKTLIVLTMLVFLGMFGWAAAQKEALLAHGQVMILKLMPIDPRSLMQGDYMELDFGMEFEIWAALERTFRDEQPMQAFKDGRAIVKLQASGLVEFVRLDDGNDLLPDEKFLKYRWRDGGVRIASGSFFFQEGHGAFYDPALYGELRVDEHGNTLIVNLLDAKMQPIRPENRKNR